MDGFPPIRLPQPNIPSTPPPPDDVLDSRFLTPPRPGPRQWMDSPGSQPGSSPLMASPGSLPSTPILSPGSVVGDAGDFVPSPGSAVHSPLPQHLSPGSNLGETWQDSPGTATRPPRTVYSGPRIMGFATLLRRHNMLVAGSRGGLSAIGIQNNVTGPMGPVLAQEEVELFNSMTYSDLYGNKLPIDFGITDPYKDLLERQRPRFSPHPSAPPAFEANPDFDWEEQPGAHPRRPVARRLFQD